MPSEAQMVLHTWCRETEWNAPTIVGGADALDLLERLLRSLPQAVRTENAS
jgi:hypothetical protein